MAAEPAVLILSSLVTADAVGGGAQAAILARAGFRPMLAPTVLFGRHPGHGPPGGAAVEAAVFEAVLGGVAARGALAGLAAVIAGYFASAHQVEIAARTIDAARAASPGVLVVVDPIMGDTETGLYVKPAVAQAIAEHLLPRADLVTPNLWELRYLVGDRHATPLAAARALGRPALVSSIEAGDQVGILYAEGDTAWLARHRRVAAAPKGTGDALTTLFLVERLTGAPPRLALEHAARAVAQSVTGDPAVTLEAL